MKQQHRQIQQLYPWNLQQQQHVDASSILMTLTQAIK